MVDAAEEYMKTLKVMLASWEVAGAEIRSAAILNPESSPPRFNQSMCKFGLLTIELIRTGDITIGKIERDAVTDDNV